MLCPNCGAPVESHQRQCPMCGIALTWPRLAEPDATPRPGPESGWPQPTSPPYPPAQYVPPPYVPPRYAAPIQPVDSRPFVAAVLDLGICALLVGGGLFVAALVGHNRGAGDVWPLAQHLGWIRVLLAIGVVAVYWMSTSYLLGRTAGQQLVRMITGVAHEGSLWRSLWPSLLVAAAVAAISGFTLPAAAGLNTQPPSQPPVQVPVSTPVQPPQVPESQTPLVDARAQAVAVDEIISGSARSKTALGTALADVCADPAGSLATLRAVEGGRASQLAAAQQLRVDGLTNGDRIRSTLIAALAHSIDADRAFERWASAVMQSGCGQDANYQNGMQASQLAQDAKRAFVTAWNPVAVQFGLPVRTQQSI
jgi:hypothetical protein